MPLNYDRADRLADMLAQGGHAAETARDIIKKLSIESDENHESIEDILRHDKGHDDWHAAHGDPPCKSEADCARMRASYDDDDGASVEKKSKYDDVISNRKGEPSNSELYQQVIREAKKKFDVYPSAYANGWVVQEYKRRGGTYSVKKAASSSFTPPESVQAEAKRALEWLKQDEQGGGFSSVGRKRASDLAAGHTVSLSTLKRMASFFARHEVDKKGTGFSPGEDGYPSPGRVAWAAWGGDAGWKWAKSVLASNNDIKKRDYERDDHGRFASGNSEPMSPNPLYTHGNGLAYYGPVHARALMPGDKVAGTFGDRIISQLETQGDGKIIAHHEDGGFTSHNPSDVVTVNRSSKS